MNENSNLLPDLMPEEFELQVRGYSRRQVDEFVSRRNTEIRDLEQRLSRALDEAEHLRRELSATRQQALNGRPAHQELSERFTQILTLADDEARAQKDKASDEIARLRAEAIVDTERVRSDAREQTERMLTAAQEQAERTIAAARGEADKTRTSARAEADRLTDDARQKADTALASAKAQSKRLLDEATARATAIHDGAERRMNLLSTRHAETIRRLSDILEGVSGLVAAETARPSLEDEVAMTVAKTVGSKSADSTGGERLESSIAPSLLSPPHPATRVDAPGSRPGGIAGAPAAARTPVRGPRQAGGPPIASPAPPSATAGTQPIATSAPPPGPMGPAGTPPAPVPPAPVPPAPAPVPPAPAQGRAAADAAGTGAGGGASRPGGADTGQPEPNKAGGEPADRDAQKGRTGHGGPDEPTEPGRIPPG